MIKISKSQTLREDDRISRGVNEPQRGGKKT